MTDQRTAQQNKALHKYLAMLSEDLNSAGLDIRRTLAEDFEIPWTAETAKELIWRQVQTAMFPDKTSTTELTTTEVDAVHQVIARHMSKKGVTTPFPDRFTQGEQQ